jgi:hypothetical protein
MSERVPHCPFLNRADSRCSNHFSLDKLDSAFDHCFGQYKSCASYAEMLSERQMRGEPVSVFRTVSNRPESVHANASYVQVRVRPQHAAAA